MDDPQFFHWPKSAIHSHLLKNGILHLSRASFYRYARRIQPNHRIKRKRRPSYQPLRARAVNEIWHMDLSYFRNADGSRSFIYAVIDNFSRKILAYRCEQKISKIYVGQVIQEAMETHRNPKFRLISDGGSENINTYIESLLLNYQSKRNISVNHQTALKHIEQSNSMIERFFHTMKHAYLYRNLPESHDELSFVLGKIILEYNEYRPHYALNHLTPSEAHSKSKSITYRKQIGTAIGNRSKSNMNCSCRVCTC